MHRRDGCCQQTGQEVDSPLGGIITVGGAYKGDGNNIYVTISDRS